MKKLYTLFVIIALTISGFAQAPQKMSYQSVIRNSGGQLVASHAVGMRISILQGSATGTAVYVETQTPTTNANGLITIEIGGGTIVTGTFAGINWATGVYYIKTETDPTGGTSYIIMGTSQILSVPYALYSRTAGNGSLWSQSGSNIYYSSGNVGIGASDPTYNLDVRGSNLDDDGVVQLGNSDLSHRLILFGGRQSDPNPFINWKQGDPLRFTTDEGGWSEKMRITSDGKIGIGTSNPATYVHAHGAPVASRGQLSLSSPDGQGTFISFYEADIFKAYLWYEVDDEDLRLQNYTAGDLNLNPYGGKVGIGTNTPGYTLDVSGNINFTGTLTQNGSPFANSWTNLTGKPTTLAGYGITDAVTNTLDIAFINSLTRGDNVLTTGGIYGKIYDIEANFVTMDVGDGVKLKVYKNALRRPPF